MKAIQLQRILLPTDFSQHSSVATDYASTLASTFDAELHLLHVFEEYTGSVYVPGVPLPEGSSEIEEVKQHAAEVLANMFDADWEARHPVVRATSEGRPFVEIIRYAKEQSIDMIVMGTHGRSGITHMLMGSVAEKVVRKSPCPVLTVCPETDEFVQS